MLGRLQHELREAYGAENARKVMLAIMETTEPRKLRIGHRCNPFGRCTIVHQANDMARLRPLSSALTKRVELVYLPE
jgi:hypothetical protein